MVVAEAKDTLRREWREWQGRQEKALIERYERALSRFLYEIQGVLAGATGMAHSNRLRSIVRGLYLPDPSNAFQNLANPTRLKQWETVPVARDRAGVALDRGRHGCVCPGRPDGAGW